MGKQGSETCARWTNAHLQVVEGELAGGFLVELQSNLQLVQLLPQASKLLEVFIRHLQQSHKVMVCALST